MPLLFGTTLFVSALLLFLIQPMIARMILPLLGGAPAVWLTCLVFFQAVLLVGYLYAHVLTTRLGARGQALVHLLVLAVPLALLPLVNLPLNLASDTGPPYGAGLVGWLGAPPTEGNPVLWQLGLLLVAVGLPFFAVSTNAPLLQKWFGGTGHAAARDPYFLYAASNAGSMAALLGYPAVVEPLLGLTQQGWLWAVGYGGLLVLVGLCAGAVWRARLGGAETPGPGNGKARQGSTGKPARAEHAPRTAPRAPLTAGRRLRWLALSFVPSSLLYGVTTFLSTDIAVVPLLWVVPLALYLLTFILVFASRRLVPPLHVGLVLPVLLSVQLVIALITIFNIIIPLGSLVALHLLTFFVAAYLCHGELADDRPPPESLTEFYLWLSVGGVLGGLFNALLAPLLFTSIAEYPLVLLAACLLAPAAPRSPQQQKRRAGKGWGEDASGDLLGYLMPPALGVLAAVLLVLVQAQMPPFEWGRVGLMLGLALTSYAAAWALSPRPLWFGVPIAVMLLAATTLLGTQGTLLHAERGFYGVLRVTLDPEGQYVRLFHGSTLHGKQHRTDDPETRREPLTYYHRAGPIGQVFAEFAGARGKPHVGLVGLGTGSLASYGAAGQTFTFYEIDPAVVRLARDSGSFTFLKECRASVDIIPGDARLSLKRAPDHHYGLLVIDAFSSDAIPVHLLTREVCEQVYLRKLAADGVLAFHISNRYLDLRPVLANLAAALSLVGRYQWDDKGDEDAGRSPSAWVLLARQEADLGKLARDERWQRFVPQPGLAVWTDDYSNILSVIRW